MQGLCLGRHAAVLSTWPALLFKASPRMALIHQSTPPWNEPEEGATKAQILVVEQETPTVKRFTFQVDKARFSFTPGQWVDFFVPGIPQVGGYSIISTPRDLEQTGGTFQLAVKRSSYPPAAWLHGQARPGDWVQVRVGGSFGYLPGDEVRPLLFLAGGIGITPLLSILQHCWQLGSAQQHCWQQEKEQAGSGVWQPLLRATVLFSASVPLELALLRDLKQLQRDSAGCVQLQLRATSLSWKGRDAEWEGKWGRFTAEDVRRAVSGLLEPLAPLRQPEGLQCSPEAERQVADAPQRPSLSEVLAFVCGPPGMLHDALQHLHAAGLAVGQIRYEKWW